ncbi:MAG: hypothetical protein K1Y02_05415 [Candidatus Hydrogenedentes bacterium]|nr:hypothetical protein [Candidatus Hydrogenedentota bacterium]
MYEKPYSKILVRQAGKGRLFQLVSNFGTLPLLHLRGSRAEMANQYGHLAGDKILTSAARAIGIVSAGLPSTDLATCILDSAWRMLCPHTPERYLEEIEAIVEGARSAHIAITAQDLERLLAVANLDLYKREERLNEFVDAEILQALAGFRPMSCTMFAVWGNRTVDGKLYALRNLDWISQVGFHEDRQITLYEPDNAPAYVAIGYGGIIGALAGMNEEGITLSEVGAFSVSEELDGTPWTLMARQVLEDSRSLDDAVGIINNTRHTIGYNYLVAHGDPRHFGTEAFAPRAAAFETNYDCCELFYDDDPKERAARWVSPSGEELKYGLPLKEAVFRADTAFGEKTRALQAADNGPGEPANDGDPRKGSSYVSCHVPMHDMIKAYETGSEYVFPIRDTKVIEAGSPRKIGPDEALNIAATVAHNTEKLHLNDWNVMSVVYGATDLDFWVAYESRDEQGNWKNAPDSGYWKLNLRELLNDGLKQG